MTKEEREEAIEWFKAQITIDDMALEHYGTLAEPELLKGKKYAEMAISALSQPQIIHCKKAKVKAVKLLLNKDDKAQGCSGCKYEATGNNSTYPCSHCSRCYTDKYKAENEYQRQVEQYQYDTLYEPTFDSETGGM